MAGTPGQEIKLFYGYTREDKALRDELEIHLSALKRQYRSTGWHDHEILPGEDWPLYGWTASNCKTSS